MSVAAVIVGLMKTHTELCIKCGASRVVGAQAGYTQAMKPVRRKNSQITILVMLLVAVAGFSMVVLGNLGNGMWFSILNQLGLAVLVSVAIGALWDFIGRRWLADELFEKMNLATDLQQWGLTKLTFEWSKLSWKEHFSSGRTLDLFIGYGRTWRNTGGNELEDFLSDPRNRLRVCLPDPSEDWLMAAMGKRFDKDVQSLRAEIFEAAKHYSKLREEHDASVQIFFRPGEPTHVAYIFERSAVVTLYRHRRGRSKQIPTFVMGQGEFLDFLTDDFEESIADAREVADVELHGN